MNRRATFIGLIAAALTAVLFVLYLRRYEIERSGGAPVKLLVLTRAVPAGAKLEDDVIGVREVPTAYVEARAIRAADRPKIVGLRAAASLEPQEILMWTDLAISSEDRRALARLVTPGFRAVYVRAVREDKGTALIRPGDYVDVIATLPRPGQGGADSRSAAVLLQKVLVLANGDRTSGDDPSFDVEAGQKSQSSRRDQGLTLSLDVREAELLALALERGELSVALRNPDDQRVFEGLGDLSPSDLEAMSGREPSSLGRRAGDFAPPVRLKESPVARVPGASR